jgi:hypothetical protein
MNFLESYQTGIAFSFGQGRKFTGFNPEVVRILLDKIKGSKNKTFRERLSKGDLMRKTISVFRVFFPEG